MSTRAFHTDALNPPDRQLRVSLAPSRRLERLLLGSPMGLAV